VTNCNSLLLAVVIGALGAACKQRDPSDSAVKYGIQVTGGHQLFSRSSILKSIADRAGKLEVLVSYKGFEALPDAAQQARLKELIAAAAQEWNSALAHSPDWGHAAIEIVDLDGDTDEYCTKGTVYWECRHENRLKVIVDAEVTRSYGSMYGAAIVLSGSRVIPQSPGLRDELGLDKNLFKRLLHEYGHLIGLADTYSEAGYQQPVGSPPAVMNSYYTVDGLTSDDEAGVLAVWRYLQGREDPCSEGYAAGASDVDPAKTRFCIPAGQAEALASLTSPDRSFRFSTKWLGPEKRMAALSSGHVGLSDEDARWQLEQVHQSEFRIKRAGADGAHRCVDIDVSSQRPVLHACSDVSGQRWIIGELGSEFVRLQTAYTGTNKCLDVINDQLRDKLVMRPCANVTGQLWRID
jgi:hypothetical protein